LSREVRICKGNRLSGDEVALNFIVTRYTIQEKGLKFNSLWCG
jgi:hypothetical protein